MNFKLKNRKLLNADVVSPDMPYAHFDEGITDRAMHTIVCNLNHGYEMIMAYEECRHNMDVRNVTYVLEKMENIFKKYSQEIYAIKKGDKTK